MSNTHQEEHPAQPEHADVSDTQPVTHRVGATESTPVKRKHGPNQAFTVEPYDFKEARNELDLEMRGHWWGPMPVKPFLNEFLPPADAPSPNLPEDPFKDVPKDGSESARYGKFIDAIQEWMPHLQAVNTSSKEDTANHLKLKTDIGIYDRIDGMTIPARTDFSRMELWMEFKTGTQGAAFRDPKNSEEGLFVPDTVEGSNTRGQMAHYAGAQHSMQFRHFSFSILVEGDNARFLRWERAGTIVTTAFNYRENPELMAEFLWRFDHMSAGKRGHDESVQPANLRSEDDARVREKLGIKANDAPLYRYTIPGMEGKGYAYGPRPPATNRSLASRFTRTSPTVWIPTVAGDGGMEALTESESSSEQGAHPEVKEGPWCEERLIYMKDTWRYLSNSPDVKFMPEHEIYEILHKHDTPNIPDLVAGGDVAGGKTRTQEFVGAEWLCVKPEVCPFQHYRLVQGVIGRPLVKFECTKQLVTGVLDALKAHSHAFEVAKLLHRDISMGNIILTDEGRGLLIDWEMAKEVNEIERRRPDRTGTWQFMSANLLENTCKIHTLTDDLESFLHVLGWIALRYVPADVSFRPIDRASDLDIFDQYLLVEGQLDEGGRGKGEALGRGSYPSEKFKPRQRTPFAGLLKKLRKPFKSLYSMDPPTAEDGEIDVSESEADKFAKQLSISVYDSDMEKLRSSSFFVDEIQKALDKKDWPTDDEADPNLPIAPLRRNTQIQKRKQTTRLLNTQNMFEDSKGLSRCSKRALSPPPEPRSSKRHRGTPAASSLTMS